MYGRVFTLALVLSVTSANFLPLDFQQSLNSIKRPAPTETGTSRIQTGNPNASSNSYPNVQYYSSQVDTGNQGSVGVGDVSTDAPTTTTETPSSAPAIQIKFNIGKLRQLLAEQGGSQDILTINVPDSAVFPASAQTSTTVAATSTEAPVRRNLPTDQPTSSSAYR